MALQSLIFCIEWFANRNFGLKIVRSFELILIFECYWIGDCKWLATLFGSIPQCAERLRWFMIIKISQSKPKRLKRLWFSKAVNQRKSRRNISKWINKESCFWWKFCLTAYHRDGERRYCLVIAEWLVAYSIY